MALKRVKGKVVGNVTGGTVLRHAKEMQSIRVYRLPAGAHQLYVEVDLYDDVSYSFYFASEEVFIKHWLKSVVRRSRNAHTSPAPITWDDRSPEQIEAQAKALVERQRRLL